MRLKRKGLIIMTMLFILSFNTVASGSIATPSNAEYKAEKEILTVDDRLVDADEFKAAYSVEIPKSIYMQRNIYSNCFEAKYELKVSNLSVTDERSCLVIEPDESFRLTADNKGDITVYVEQEEIEFSNLIQDDLTDLHITTGYLYTEEPLSSASWKGSFSFTISVVDLGETIGEDRTATISNAEQETVDEVLDEKAEEKTEPSIESSLGSVIESSESIEESVIESSESTEESSSIEPSESIEESSSIESSESIEESVIEPSESTEESSSVEPSESIEESNIEPSESIEESNIESSESIEESNIESSESIEEDNNLEESSSMEELVC